MFKAAKLLHGVYKVFDKFMDFQDRLKTWQRKVDEATPRGCPISNSFTPETPVLLGDGKTLKPISKVTAGEEVMAEDPVTGERGPREVTNVIVGRGEKRLVALDITSSDAASTQRLVATDGHPFWEPGTRSWTDADALMVGGTLRAADGSTAFVTGVKIEIVQATVFNLTVDGLHTYFVGSGDTAASSPVLVHNCGGDGWTSRANRDEHFDRHGEDMGFESPAEYGAAAEDLMCTCAGVRPGVQTKGRGNETHFLDPVSGEFGITSPRGIVTYYRPDNPRRHFDEQ